MTVEPDIENGVKSRNPVKTESSGKWWLVGARSSVVLGGLALGMVAWTWSYVVKESALVGECSAALSKSKDIAVDMGQAERIKYVESLARSAITGAKYILHIVPPLTIGAATWGGAQIARKVNETIGISGTKGEFVVHVPCRLAGIFVGATLSLGVTSSLICRGAARVAGRIIFDTFCGAKK